MPTMSAACSRRAILKTGAMSVALIGFGGCDMVRTDLAPAQAPWDHAKAGFGDPRLDALAYAVLAPNPHNRQPWLIDLSETDSMTLYADLDRLLPETDPPNRQITIGLGAFLEVLRIAATAQGRAIEIDQFPDGEPFAMLDDRPVARVRFLDEGTASLDPLFKHVLNRRTNRLPFDPNAIVSAETLKSLDTALRPDDGEFEWANDATNVTILKELCTRAWHVEARTPRTHGESVALMRIGQGEVNGNPDGIALVGAAIEISKRVGIITRDKLYDQSSRAFAETIKFYDAAIDTAMAFGWLTTAGNSRKDQLNAGAGWVRLHLKATELGLALHPLSQCLQEFPEMAAAFEGIHNFVGLNPPARVQGLFRFGYAKSPPQAPRWTLESRIITA